MLFKLKKSIRNCVLMLSLFSLWANGAHAEPIRGRLLFFGVAYDEAPPKGLTVNHYDYAPDNFSRLLREQSRDLFREIQVATLKGNAATHDAVLSRLKELAAQATKEDLVFVYWGTHGSTVNRDWEANLPGGSKIQGREIKAELGRCQCPVVVIISTCGAGGFAKPGPGEVDLPDNVAAFCACRRQQSTNNELDVTLLEALAGFGDLDNDGQVTLKEAFHYVPRRYRKLMQAAKGKGTEPVLGHSPNFPLDLPLAKSNERRVAAAYGGVWYGAQILERGTGQHKVRYLGWNPATKRGPFGFPDGDLNEESLDLPGGFPPIEVEWNGTWYPATVVERRGDQFQIHYVGYPQTDDEAVPLNRIRYPFLERPLSLEATTEQ